MTSNLLAWVSITGIDPSSPGDVAVYNLQTDKLIAMIPVGIDPRFLKCTPDGSKVYVPNSGSDTLSVISTQTLNVEKVIPVGKGPRTVVINSPSAKLYVTNYGSHSISILDISSETLLETITVGTSPLGLALSHTGDSLYVTNQGDNSLSVMNTLTHSIKRTIPVGARPNGLALTPDDTRVYVVNTGDNTVSVINTETDQIIASIPVGLIPQKIAIHPSLSLAYVTNFNSNSVSVLSTETNELVTTLKSLITPTDITLSPDGSQILVTHDYEVTVIDVETLAQKSLYPPPTAQIRQGVAVGEVGSILTEDELSHAPNHCISKRERNVRYVFENVPIIYPRPLNFTFNVELKTDFSSDNSSKPKSFENISFANGEIDKTSLVTRHVPSKPHYYQLSFSMRIPYKAIVKNDHNQLYELKGISPPLPCEVQIFIPPTRSSSDLDLNIFSQTELSQAPTLYQNFLTLNTRTQLQGIRRILKVYTRRKCN